MRSGICRIAASAIASAAFFVSSCGGSARPMLTPPADLLYHTPEPAMTAEALDSEELYEAQREAKIEWGRDNAAMLDRACWWFQDAGVSLHCPKRPD